MSAVRAAATVKLPRYFSFKYHDVFDFERPLGVFDWSLNGQPVELDFRECHSANYQALSLFVLYVWHLKLRACRINFAWSDNRAGASDMWRKMGGFGWSRVLLNPAVDFNSSRHKPLIAMRSQTDFAKALAEAQEYAKGFNVEYERTLRYVVSELLYNTLEHGTAFRNWPTGQLRVPSIIQFTWYKKVNELHFIVADLGVGIKKHLEQAYPAFESHEAAIRASIRPNVSGTFEAGNPYASTNNAGVGLYISSNIVRRINADMHICSGDGLVHISPTDTTSKTLAHGWPGTIVLVSLKLGHIRDLRLQTLMQEFRSSAQREIEQADRRADERQFYISIENYFGTFAEDKESAIKYRERYLMPAVENGYDILLDFSRVQSAPHSFLSALLSSPIRSMGMAAYKKLKVTNAEPGIRETIDFILDENTDPPVTGGPDS